MKLAPIVDRLKGSGAFPRVYGALELAGLTSRPERLPALFVVPEGEDAQPNSLVGAHDQAASFTFGVVIMLDGQSRNEERIADDLAEQQEKVIDALAGWTHPEASRACDYAGGRLLSADRQALSWFVRFRTRRHIRKAAT